MENIVQFLVSDKASATRVVQILHHLSSESLLSLSDIYLVRRDKKGKVIFTEAFNLPTDERIWFNTADPMTMVKTPFDFVDATFSGDDTGALSDLTLSDRISQSLPLDKIMIMAHLTESELSIEQLQSRLKDIAQIKRIGLDISSNGMRTVNSSSFFSPHKARRGNLLLRRQTQSAGYNMQPLDSFDLKIDDQKQSIKQEIRKMEDESAVTPWQEKRDPLSSAIKNQIPLPQAQYKLENTITPQDMRNIENVSKQKIENEIESHSLKQRVVHSINKMSGSIEDAAQRFSQNNMQGFSFFERLLMFFGFTPARVRHNK